MRSSTAHRVIARRALVVFGAAVLTVPFVATSAFSAPTTNRAAIAGSTPSWAQSAHDVGAPSAAAKISFNVVLPLRNAAGAEKAAASVSDPKSSSYGHYLSAASFNAQFAPTASQVSKVRDFLTGTGIAVTGVAPGNRWVTASGTVKQVESAFATTLRNYTYKGHTMRAPSRSLSVPTGIVGLISGVVGVTNDGTLRKPNIVTTAAGSGIDVGTAPSDALPPVQPCSTFFGQNHQVGPMAYGKTSFPTPICGYAPAQLRGAYDVQSAVSHGNNGHGVTVAIVDAYANPTMLADSNALSASQGEPLLTSKQYTETVFGPFTLQTDCGGEFGWNEEESLDVEAVHGLAPGANIHYVGAANCDTGIDDAVNYIIQNHVANVVSNSYGFAGEDGLGDEVATEHSLFVQAAAEGIGFYFSSGDQGDNTPIGAPHPEPDFPASDPLVTAIGGTSLAVTSSKKYQFETSWGDQLDAVNTATSPSSYVGPPPGPRFFAGAGGGTSALFTEPAYQKLAVPKALAKANGNTAMRVVPDVAAVADPETGFLIEVQGTLVTIGGTSLACPVFAGIQALASQGRFFPIGFANPLLYTLGLTGLAFHDVKAPATTQALMTSSGSNLVTLGDDTSLTATKGYDNTTGLGTPSGTWLLLGEHLLP
jgi:subtilase family serine protease